MKNNREPVNGPRAAHNLANPSEALESGPGWIRTNDTSDDDSGRLAPRSDPQGSELTETAGTSSPETVGLPFDDPPEDADGPKVPVDYSYTDPRCFLRAFHVSDCECVLTSPREPAPQISLDDRFSVAIAARGSLRICQLIVNATGASDPFYIKDEDLVALVEAYVFEGQRA